MGLFGNFENSQAQSTQLSEIESDRYSRMVSYLVCLTEFISDYGMSIEKLKELYNNDLKSVSSSHKREFPDSRTIDNCIKVVSGEFNNIVSDEDKPIYDMITMIVSKYNLKDINQVVAKLNELDNNSDIMYRLINNINSINPGVVTDEQSLMTYISELIKNNANFASVQQNSQTLFTNLNATLNENALLKAQNEQLKQRLASLGVC